MKYTTKYQEILDYNPRNLRSYAREVVLNGLALSNQLSVMEKWLKRPRIQFLYFHHAFDDELEKLDKLMKILAKHHTFISYTEAVDKLLTGKIDTPYICFSSDDGFKNNLKAAEILDRYGAKCCFFINPDAIDLNDFDGVKRFCKERLHFPPVEFMNWHDVEHLLSTGHEIGSHTMGHIKITETPLTEVEDNLVQAYDILNSKCGKVKHFAYPYGRFFHFNKEAYDLTFKVGYKSCTSAERGCHIATQAIKREELFLRRDHVIFDWNINHTLFFILKSARKANILNNYVPYEF